MAPMAPSATPAKTPATNPAPVVLPPDTLGQYGKILTPSDQMDHPLKLKMPFPGVGEVKVPNQDELGMREKLEQLAMLSDDDIRAQLAKWPAFSKMNLRDEGLMLQRIQDFRDYRTRVAMQKAHDLGLLTLTPDQKTRFEKDYWNKRLQMDHEMAKLFEPQMKARAQKMEDELFREYSSISVGPTVPPVSKPAAAPMAQSKAAISVSAPATNMGQPMEPMAQAPK
jgi:hypothetical protein